MIFNPFELTLNRFFSLLVKQNFRVRKCSIVQEEDDEDDMSSCSGRDDHGSSSTQSSVSRRGSRSEGKLSHVLQEKLSQNPEKHSIHSSHLHAHQHLGHDPITISVCNKTDSNKSGYKSNPKVSEGVENQTETTKANKFDEFRNNIDNSETEPASEAWIKKPGSIDGRPKSVTDYLKSSSCNKWRMGAKHQTKSSLEDESVPVTTTILTVSSTVSIPLHTTVVLGDSELVPKYKSLPAPLPELSLNEILEDRGVAGLDNSKNRIVRRTSYEQRRSKFHKTRTASCSSSDASDDDSEGRKKRAHKLGTSGSKPLPPRRDSHDDSSDSQDPGGNGGSGVGGATAGSGHGRTLTDNRDCTTSSSTDNTKNNGGSNGTTGGKRCSVNQANVFERRHRTGRRRSGETRLRESQSLNRITEVQEAEAPCHSHSHTHTVSTTVVSQYTASASVNVKQKAKGFGARLLHSWSSSSGRKSVIIEEKVVKQSAAKESDSKSPIKFQNRSSRGSEKEKENRGVVNKGGSNTCKNKKLHLLSRYFAIHKKLCIPLPSLFGKGRLYKAQSCGSITRDRVSVASPKSVLLYGTDDSWSEQRLNWAHNNHRYRGSDGDINQNLDLAHLVNNVAGKECNATVPTTCHIHFGDPSKCCSLC